MTSHVSIKAENDYQMTSHCVVMFPLKRKNDYQMTSHLSIQALLLLFAFVDKLFYQKHIRDGHWSRHQPLDIPKGATSLRSVAPTCGHKIIAIEKLFRHEAL